MNCMILLAAAVSIAYGSGPDQVGDLYLPARMSDSIPVVLSIHGGGWTSMKRQDVRGIAEFLAESGCAVYNIDYRLASPQTPWPACGEDCLKAAKFMLTGGLRAYGVSPRRIWLIGGSAGGHLALWTGLGLPSEQVAGVVSVSGIADPMPDAVAHPDRYRALFGGREPVTADFASIDVTRLLRKGGPRILLTHAKEDGVVPEASALNFCGKALGLCDVSLVRYSCEDEPNTGGHCIWRKGVDNPRRLLALLEKAIVRFVRQMPDGGCSK